MIFLEYFEMDIESCFFQFHSISSGDGFEDDFSLEKS